MHTDKHEDGMVEKQHMCENTHTNSLHNMNRPKHKDTTADRYHLNNNVYCAMMI